MKKKDGFVRTVRVGRDISIKEFLKSRILTPKEIINAIKDPDIPNYPLSSLIFFARYKALKAIPGYDFTDSYPEDE